MGFVEAFVLKCFRVCLYKKKWSEHQISVQKSVETNALYFRKVSVHLLNFFVSCHHGVHLGNLFTRIPFKDSVDHNVTWPFIIVSRLLHKSQTHSPRQPSSFRGFLVFQHVFLFVYRTKRQDIVIGKYNFPPEITDL